MTTRMDLRGARVVITGAGNGIGAAMARRFARDGARVVVNDRDAVAARRVADDIDRYAVTGDVARAGETEALVAAARERLGGIDLFCANAGAGTPGGPDADDEQWDAAWQVNVMAHVRAARALLPEWLERGSGHFLASVSAAGLLTMLGSAPYSVTKHGALAFAEWLSTTYGDKGITVQALCPQGVRTAMLAETGHAGQLLLTDTAVSPEEVADMVAASLGNGFLILPHPEVRDYYAIRASDTDRWLAGMRRLQSRLDALKDTQEART